MSTIFESMGKGILKDIYSDSNVEYKTYNKLKVGKTYIVSMVTETTISDKPPVNDGAEILDWVYVFSTTSQTNRKWRNFLIVLKPTSETITFTGSSSIGHIQLI